MQSTKLSERLINKWRHLEFDRVRAVERDVKEGFRCETEGGFELDASGYGELDWETPTLEFPLFSSPGIVSVPSQGACVCGVQASYFEGREATMQQPPSVADCERPSSAPSLWDLIGDLESPNKKKKKSRSLSSEQAVPPTRAPDRGATDLGTREDGDKKRFVRWFLCSDQFMRLHSIVGMGGTPILSEGGVYRELTTQGCKGDESHPSTEGVAARHRHVYCLVASVVCYNTDSSSQMLRAFGDVPGGNPFDYARGIRLSLNT